MASIAPRRSAGPNEKRLAREAARARAERVDWLAVGRRARAQLSRWLAERPATTVLLYLALGHEASVEELVADPALAGHAWAVPRVGADGRLSAHPLDSPLELHRYGFRQPRAGAPLVADARIGVVLVPGLAFDRWGGRLGHGKGHYDHFLPRLRAGVALVGVTAEELVADEPLPREAHDVPVAWLATERGVRPAAPGRRSSG